MFGEVSQKVVNSSSAANLAAESRLLFCATSEQKLMMVGNIGLNILGARSTRSIKLSKTEAKAVSLPFSKSLGKELSKFGNRELKLVH
ncbi:hypothetical protein OGAPHI_006438 [Ogataea philodendri]|uniref:Uncharacterized protein n=1 Tax=Ogataea philodendri TaxID=1378263 RepID=A0A9P8NXI1_9ASCO|nr:uncharacterized protein OGAPHI_006438 [Ogataea philodendri]KAH3661590.1 hypothetical protein OGAPHI_006438 [Ogataea philodendri]